MEMEQPTQTPPILAEKLKKTRTLHRVRINMVRA